MSLIRVPQDQATIAEAVCASAPHDTLLLAPGVHDAHRVLLTHPVNLRGDSLDIVAQPVIVDGDGGSGIPGANPCGDSISGLLGFGFTAVEPDSFYFENVHFRARGSAVRTLNFLEGCAWPVGKELIINRCLFESLGNGYHLGGNTASAIPTPVTARLINCTELQDGFATVVRFGAVGSAVYIEKCELLDDSTLCYLCDPGAVPTPDYVLSPTSGYGYGYGQWFYPFPADQPGELRGRVLLDGIADSREVRIFRADRDQWVRTVQSDTETGNWVAGGLDPGVLHYAAILPTDGSEPWIQGPGYPRIP